MKQLAIGSGRKNINNISKHKKIVIIGSAYPLRGGLAAFNERIAYAFQEKGYEVTLYTFSLQYPSLLFPGKSQYSTDPFPAGLNIQVKINSINPFNWLQVGNEIRKLQPDMVIIKYWLPFMAPCFGTILRRIKKNHLTKIVCILDNVIPHEKRPGDVALTKYFLKPVDAFIAMSREVLKDLRQFTQKKAMFVPHPIYDNFGTPVSKEEAKSHLQLQQDISYILFFGFIRKYKGLDIILEAMNEEELKRKNIHLIVAGEFYESRQLYDEIIHKYQLQSRLELHTEFISNEAVKYYFCAADLVVQPYRSATQSGISQMAYHFDKPMIVTNVGGLPEIVPDEKVGYVCEPQPEAIAKAINRFYDEKKEKEFVENIREEKKKFDWSNMTNNIIALAESGN